MNAVRDMLRANFPPQVFKISTWRDKEGALLAAVQMETAVLNVLLFLIIAVAGFGILAIFFMIVVEKTRDIGILKSLGATGRGIMGIFLGYGLCLGIVGAGVGLGLGLLFVRLHQRDRRPAGPGHGPARCSIRRSTTSKRFRRSSNGSRSPGSCVGAMAIAVLASILPARRAARLHPVEALRYE